MGAGDGIQTFSARTEMESLGTDAIQRVRVNCATAPGSALKLQCGFFRFAKQRQVAHWVTKIALR